MTNTIYGGRHKEQWHGYQHLRVAFAGGTCLRLPLAAFICCH